MAFVATKLVVSNQHVVMDGLQDSPAPACKLERTPSRKGVNAVSFSDRWVYLVLAR
jgi:hypothetical protein